MNLAGRIDRELKRLGLTNPAAAERLDVSKETVRSLRHGRTEPTASVLVRLSELTGRSVEWLVLGREPEPGYTDDERFIVGLIRDMNLSRPEVVRRLTGWPESHPHQAFAPRPRPGDCFDLPLEPPADQPDTSGPRRDRPGRTGTGSA